MIAVVMAGGAGTRLWPASRVRRPKQFLDLLGGRSLLEETLARVTGLVPPERVMVAANAAHRELTAVSLADGMRAVYEPAGRGTAPCLGLAILHLAGEDPDAVVVALPADNWIAPGPDFARAIHRAAGLARTNGLVTIGTVPAWPASGFGYIKPGKPRAAAPGWPPAFHLEAFIEKPGAELAARLCAEGWLWNAGIFVFRPAVLRAEIERLQPLLAAALARIEKAVGTPAYETVLAEAWRTLPVISVDEGLLARAPREAVVVRGDYAWSDLGTWDAIRRAAMNGPAGNAIRGDAYVSLSKDCLVRAEGGRFVAVVGAEGLTVIDTPDALLVLGPGCGQEVRRVAAYLAEWRRELL